MIKKLISCALSACMLMGTCAAVCAADTGTGDKPLISIVGKVIDGDDQYFEVSLEVNSQERELSAVSAALQYDPQYLLPVTWDGRDIDMTSAVGWDSRQAMPTLCEDAWNASTALTCKDTDTNYYNLFLSAEYPGKAAVSTDTSVEATAEPTLPADASGDTGMVVVVRFKYASETAKAYIENNWVDVTAAMDKTVTVNSILWLAPDDDAKESPSYYPVGIYYKDGFEVFVNNTDNFTDISVTNNTAAGKFEVILGHGKSAKAGGLTLNDVSVVLFFDWDDSFMGAIALQRDQDGSEAINNYVRKNFIHPDIAALQAADGYSFADKTRANNYRGEYPAEGPGGTLTVTDGANYPLTNKLDYVLYNLDGTMAPTPTPAAAEGGTEGTGEAAGTAAANYPYANCWREVQPLTMSDEWTALSAGDAPEVCDFSVIDKSEIYVKALYYPGENLNNNGSGSINNNYLETQNVEYLSLNKATKTAGNYSITFKYFRINDAGYGVSRIRKPGVRMEMTPTGSTVTSTMQVDVENGETIEVELTPSKNIQKVTSQLVETYGYNIVTAPTRSFMTANGGPRIMYSDGDDGFIKVGTLNKISEALIAYGNGDSSGFNSLDYIAMADAGFTTYNGKNFTSAAFFNQNKTYIQNCGKYAAQAGYTELTYNQIQYYINQKSKTADGLLSPEDADAQFN